MVGNHGAKLNCGRRQAMENCGWLPKVSRSVIKLKNYHSLG